MNHRRGATAGSSKNQPASGAPGPSQQNGESSNASGLGDTLRPDDKEKSKSQPGGLERMKSLHRRLSAKAKGSKNTLKANFEQRLMTSPVVSSLSRSGRIPSSQRINNNSL
uniref:WH2 domain-containing protein n=1 Tax=Panagrellus redivivus TaxID=6233 RepID=A0A7E4ZZR1_PANRE